MTYSQYIALCEKIGKDELILEKPWNATKYCDLVTHDIQDLITKERFTAEEDCELLSLIEHSNEDIFGNSKQISFIDPNFSHAFSIVINDDIIDIYDIVNRFEETKYPINIIFIKNEHFKDGKFVYKLGNDEPIHFRTNRPLTDSDYDIIKKDSDGNIVESFDSIGDYTLSIVCKGNYEGQGTCKVQII